MNKEVIFFLKLLRNGLILAGLLFVSIWATNDLSLAVCKTVGVFYLGYVLTELAVHYKLKMPERQLIDDKGARVPLFF